MLGKTIALFVAALLLSGMGLMAIASDKDNKAIQGTWEASKDDKKIQLTFEGNKFTFRIADASITGTVTTDSKKKPYAIDMTVTDTSDEGHMKYKGKTSKGIFEVDGDKLKWCASEPGADERPTEFAEAKGKKCITFERAKK